VVDFYSLTLCITSGIYQHNLHSIWIEFFKFFTILLHQTYYSCIQRLRKTKIRINVFTVYFISARIFRNERKSFYAGNKIYHDGAQPRYLSACESPLLIVLVYNTKQIFAQQNLQPGSKI
jgi:hypothetical protein